MSRRRRRKVTKISFRQEADFYLVQIQDDIYATREVLDSLTELAIYNAEMEKPHLRLLEADDMRHIITGRLDEIEQLAEMVTGFVR